jgi:hypothetical protein
MFFLIKQAYKMIKVMFSADSLLLCPGYDYAHKIPFLPRVTLPKN